MARSRVAPDPMGGEMGEMLRKKRERLGFTQAQVAEKIGVSQDALNLWERGKSIPRFDRAVRWAESLGYDLWPLEVR